jgi:prepilin-type N-terminal cleavage/methylation domain-containing protein
MTGDAPVAGRAAGFTLLEMIVALIVVSLALAIGGATLARRDMTPTPVQVARQMQGLMLQARSDAVREGRDASVLVDVAGRRYAYPPEARPVALPEGTEIALQAAAAGAGGGGALIVFRADGSASGGDVMLTDGRHADARLAVNWLTGLPRLVAGAPQ